MQGITSGLVDRTLQVGDCVLTATRHEPLLKLPVHDHEHPNINIVGDGYLDEVVERFQFSCRPFSSLLKPAGAKHANTYGRKETRCLIVEFMPKFNLGRDRKRAVSEVRYADSLGARNIAQKIWWEFCLGDSSAPLVIEGLILELLGLHMRTDRVSSVPDWLQRCREILENSFTDPPSISGLSRQLNIDRSHLTKEFTRHFGVSPGLYVRHRRLEKAREILTSTTKPISAIAMELGFFDQSHFTRAFAVETGMTPSAFRRRSSSPQKY